MALPSFLGNFTVGTSGVYGKNLHDSGLYFCIAPDIPTGGSGLALSSPMVSSVGWALAHAVHF